MIVTIPNTEDDNSILLEPETIWKNYVTEGYITQVLYIYPLDVITFGFAYLSLTQERTT